MKAIKAILFSSLALSSLSAGAAQPIINLGAGGKLTPGVYGQVKFGKEIPPLVYPEPKVIVIYTHPVKQEPVYLHVPPAHAKQWDKHCREYNACSRPAYFVKSREYEPGYVQPKSKIKQEEKNNRVKAGQDKTQGDNSRNGRGDGSGDGSGKNKGKKNGSKAD